MDELNGTVQSAPAGQPENVQPQTTATVAKPEPVVQGQGQAAGQEPQVLTEQRVLELATQIAQKISEEQAVKVIKQAQSLTDKLDARFRNEYAARISAVESALGSPLTDAQKWKLEKETRQQIVNESQQEEQPQELPQQTSNPIQLEVQKIGQKYGNTIVTMSDPEASLVKTDGSLFEWSQTYEQAVKAKRERLSPNQTPSQDSSGNAQARIAQTPQHASGGLPDVSAIELFKMKND